jgi:hypothetical protein
MAFGIIGYSQQSSAYVPSGSIWGDCMGIEYLDLGIGYFKYSLFFENQTQPGMPSAAANSGTFTLTQASESDGVYTPASLLVTTGATAQNGAALWLPANQPIIPNSGASVWFEANVALASVTNVSGLFVGLANEDAQNDALISGASGTAGSNAIAAAAGSSIVGFWMHGDTLGNFDAVYVNDSAGTGLTPSTISVVLADVLTANANNPNPGNPNYTPPAPPGVLTVGEFVKLGLRYDGIQFLYFYVNGAQVAKMLVTGNLDTVSDYGPIVALTTGAAAAHTANVQFLRYANGPKK